MAEGSNPSTHPKNFMGLAGSIRLPPADCNGFCNGRLFQLAPCLSDNIFNHPTFALPGNTLSAPSTFGYYSDTETDSRNMTLALRLIW